MVLLRRQTLTVFNMFCQQCKSKRDEGDKFCTSCVTLFIVDNNIVGQGSVSTGIRNKKGADMRKVLLSLLVPPALLFILLSIWGIVNVLSATFDSGKTFITIVNSLMPILIGLSVPAIPVGVVFAIYFYLQRGESDDL